MPYVQFGTFSLDVLPDWTLSTVILAGPVEEDSADDPMLINAPTPFQSNIIITLEQVKGDEIPESYLNRQLDGLRQANVNFQQMAPPERVKLENGLDGILSEQVIVGAGGEWVRQLQLMFIKDGVAYTAIASQLEGPPFEKMRDRFRAMLLSLK